MSNVIRDEITELVDKELDAANKKFGLNHSDHESYAVLHEEVDEAREALALVEYQERIVWNAVKSNADSVIMRKLYEKVYDAAVNLAVEAAQVAAMARKAICSNLFECGNTGKKKEE